LKKKTKDVVLSAANVQ